MSKRPWYKKEVHIKPVSRVDVVTMTENLAVMLRAGLPVPEALDVLVDAASGRLRTVLQKVSKEVNVGNSLGDAIEKAPSVFNPIFVSAVRIGEGTGTLSENLVRLAEQVERELQVRRNVQAAMLYPAIVVTATLIVGFGLAAYVLPQMADVFSSLGTELPWTTRVLIWSAELFDTHGTIIAPGFFAGLLGLGVLLRQRFIRPFIDGVALKIPAIGAFIHDVNRARFCRAIGTLLESGVPIQEGLHITSASLPNDVYRKSLVRMYERISSGELFSDIVAEFPNLYPKMIQRMVAVGEHSGGLGESLLYLARYYEQKVDVQSKNFSTIIEPILLLFIGSVVAFVAISIFTPIYSITDALSL